MYNKARVPAVEMLVGSHSSLQFLQQSTICALAFGMHGGAHIIQHAHHTWRVLKGAGMEAIYLFRATTIEVEKLFFLYCCIVSFSESMIKQR